MTRDELWKHRLSNWACGALTITTGALTGGVVLALYRWLATHTWGSLPTSPLTFVAAFIAIDVIYYLHHRAEHRHPALWAIHAVHHQSNLCDTSVSLRTSMFAPLTVLLTHLPLAVLGVPAAVYVPMYLLHAALVFLLHSRTPKWFDRAGWVFNSPYLHRAHHSTHPRLRGKNLGGVFIIWDRVAGTFEPQCDDATEYGIGQRATPLNPVFANVSPLREWLRAHEVALARILRRTHGSRRCPSRAS